MRPTPKVRDFFRGTAAHGKDETPNWGTTKKAAGRRQLRAVDGEVARLFEPFVSLLPPKFRRTSLTEREFTFTDVCSTGFLTRFKARSNAGYLDLIDQEMLASR